MTAPRGRVITTKYTIFPCTTCKQYLHLYLFQLDPDEVGRLFDQVMGSVPYPTWGS